MNGQLSFSFILDLIIICCCVYSCSSACRRRNCKTRNSRILLNESNTYMNMWNKCVLRSDCRDNGFKKRFKNSPKMFHRLSPFDISARTSLAQQCVEQIAKDDMCFEVKNSNLTFCVFKNTDIRSKKGFQNSPKMIPQKCIEQITKADMCFEVKNSNSTFCVFKNTEQFFLYGIHIYTPVQISTMIGDGLCALCCRSIYDKDIERCVFKFCSSLDQRKKMCKF
eukprot:XP_019927976.1 PREDICTED: uncharacterized protein LOC105340798 [Crassostrea gigas]